MEKLISALIRMTGFVITSFGVACASTPHAPGEITLPAGETTGFRIVDSNVQMTFLHTPNAAPIEETDLQLFAVRFIKNQQATPVMIRFDNEDCDQLISYSVRTSQEGSGSAFEYFDNVIPTNSTIELQVTNEEGKPILRVNDRRIPLNIKGNYRRVAIDTDSEYMLSFSGLKPKVNEKDK